MLDPVVDVVEERGKNLEMATDAAGKSRTAPVSDCLCDRLAREVDGLPDDLCGQVIGNPHPVGADSGMLMKEHGLEEDLDALLGREREVRDHAFERCLLLADGVMVLFDGEPGIREDVPFIEVGCRAPDLGGLDGPRLDVAAAADARGHVAERGAGKKERHDRRVPRRCSRHEVGADAFFKQKEPVRIAAALENLACRHIAKRPMLADEVRNARRFSRADVGKGKEDLSHGRSLSGWMVLKKVYRGQEHQRKARES